MENMVNLETGFFWNTVIAILMYSVWNKTRIHYKYYKIIHQSV